MTKLILVVAVGLGAYFAYANVLRPPPKRACAHLRTLCTDELSASDANDCPEFFDAIKTNASPADADKVAQCVLDAKTCPESFGCLAAGGLKLGTSAATSFLT